MCIQKIKLRRDWRQPTWHRDALAATMIDDVIRLALRQTSGLRVSFGVIARAIRRR